MRFIVPPQTFAEAKFREFPVYEVWAETAAAVVTAGGMAYSSYSSSEAKKNNASLSRSAAQAQVASQRAQAQVDRYQHELNYKTSLAKADQFESNAKLLNQYARNQEKQGVEQINRSLEGQAALDSTVRAAYSSSGIAADSGSPLMVEAYNASQAQLARMDASYKTNLAAADTDWKASLSQYQADLTRETAKQYQYGMDMADWQGGEVANFNSQMANSAYDNSITAANNSATAGYISATGSLLSAGAGMMKPGLGGNMSSAYNKQNLINSSASTVPNSSYQTQSLAYRPSL